MTPEQIASQAASLRDNDAFQMALTTLRVDALEALAVVNRGDGDAISRLQATVKVVDDLRGNLEQFIRSGQKPRTPGIA